MIKSVWLPTALAALLFSSLTSYAELSTCRPSFPLKPNIFGFWMGGDVAHSISVDAKTVMWVFGDSFIGKPSDRDRHGVPMVGSSAALGICDRGKYQLHYQWKVNSAGQPVSLFPSPQAGVNTWPEQPHRFQGKVFVVLTETEPGTGGSLGFKVVGASLARISNFSTRSAEWKIDRLPLYSGSMIVGHGSVVAGGYLYLLNHRENNTYLSRLALTRVLDDSVRDARPHVEYLSLSTGKWLAGWNERDMTPMGFSASGGSTLFRNTYLNQWQIVYHDGSVFGGPEIHSRVASSLMDTWSDPRVVYQIPESNTKHARYNKEVFCYTGFNHPEFTPNQSRDELVITYVCNGVKSDVLFSDMSVYRPRVVRVPNPWRPPPPRP